MDSNIKKIQLAGILVGQSRELHLEFNVIARQLRAAGFDVWTPSELHERNTSPFNRSNCLRKSIRSLMDRDALIEIPCKAQPANDVDILVQLAKTVSIDVLNWETLRRHLNKLRKLTVKGQ